MDRIRSQLPLFLFVIMVLCRSYGGIAKVFPVFFFLVAALVCMTTMTRMVDEQRNEMGTLKALGYSKLQIASKYIIYALIASILGLY